MNHDLQVKALEEAVSYPPYKEEDGVFTVVVDNFDQELIMEEININKSELANLEGERLNLITDIISLIDNNKQAFNVNKVNYFVFYWRGLPSFGIKVGEEHTKQMMYISVKTYRDGYTSNLTSRNLLTGGAVLLGGALVVVTGMFLFKRIH